MHGLITPCRLRATLKEACPAESQVHGADSEELATDLRCGQSATDVSGEWRMIDQCFLGAERWAWQKIMRVDFLSKSEAFPNDTASGRDGSVGKRLPYKLVGLSSILRIQVTMRGTVICTYNPDTGEAEAGGCRQLAGSHLVKLGAPDSGSHSVSKNRQHS